MAIEPPCRTLATISGLGLGDDDVDVDEAFVWGTGNLSPNSLVVPFPRISKSNGGHLCAVLEIQAVAGDGDLAYQDARPARDERLEPRLVFTRSLSLPATDTASPSERASAMASCSSLSPTHTIHDPTAWIPRAG